MDLKSVFRTVKTPVHDIERAVHGSSSQGGFLVTNSNTMGQGLRRLATDAASKLYVLGENGDAPAVDGTEIDVFKQPDEVGLGSRLKGMQGMGVAAHVGAEAAHDFPGETLKRKLANEQMRRLLVLADLAESDGARTVAVGLLDTPAVANGRFAGRVNDTPSSTTHAATGGGRLELNTRGVPPGRPPRRLFGACHPST